MKGGPAAIGCRRWWVRYGLASVFVAGASALGREVSPEWSSAGGHPYLVAWPAIILAAWVGGLGPGLLATVLSVLEISCSIGPFGPFRLEHPGDLLAVVTFGACGVVVALLTESLHVARHKAERSRIAREEVLEIVAHDLRSPLSTVLVAAALLRRNAEDWERGLDRIERAGHTIERLIRDLLDASVLDGHGDLSMILSEEDPASLVGDAVEAASGSAAQRSIAIVSEMPAGLPQMRCDRARVLQVLGNLLGNAVKFTAEGGRIAIRAVALDGFVRIEVADSGSGIRPEDQAHVFERHWSASRGRGGLGLGLYIAHGIVRAHGGRLWLRSETAQGTSFFLNLPVSSESSQRETCLAEKEPCPGDGPASD